MSIGSILGSALLGGGIGGIAGVLGNRTKTRSTLDPYQQSLQKTLGGYLNQNMAPQYYGGQLTADMTPQEEGAIGNFGRFSALSGNTLEQLINLNDTDFNNRFDEEMARPTFRSFKEEIQPLIEESLPSFSIARGQAVERGARDVGDLLLQQRFAARESARDRALNAIGAGQNLGMANIQAQSIPRALKQAGLDRIYSDYIGANERSQANISSALNFLGIDTQAQEPTTTSRVLSGILGGAQAGATLGIFGQQSGQDPSTQGNDYMDYISRYYGGYR